MCGAFCRESVYYSSPQMFQSVWGARASPSLPPSGSKPTLVVKLSHRRFAGMASSILMIGVKYVFFITLKLEIVKIRESERKGCHFAIELQEAALSYFLNILLSYFSTFLPFTIKIPFILGLLASLRPLRSYHSPLSLASLILAMPVASSSRFV